MSFLANTIVGNKAQNAINGGDGRDTLTGQGGNDSFVFATAPGPGDIDTITDFARTAGNDDRILLDNRVFTTLAEGPLATGSFRSNATGLATDPDDRIILETDRGRVYYGGNALVAVLMSDGDFASAARADFLVI